MRGRLSLAVTLLACCVASSAGHGQLATVTNVALSTSGELFHIRASDGALLTPSAGSAVTGCCSFLGAVSAQDAPGRRLFFMARNGNTGVKTLFVVNAATGSLLSSPTLSDSFEYDYLEYVAPTLYVVYHAAGFVFHLASVNTTTGALTPIGGTIGDSCCSQFTGLDAAGDGAFRFIAGQQGNASPRLWSLSLATGALLANPLISPGTSQVHAIARHARTGAIHVLTRTASGEQLATINTTTGALTNVGSATASCCNFSSGPPLFGYGGGLFYFIAANDGADFPKRLFAIDESSGALTSHAMAADRFFQIFEPVVVIFINGFESGNTSAW